MEPARYIVALDQGTTSSRAIIFNHQSEIVGSVQREFTQYFPKPGWVEHNPMEIWASQSAALTEVMAKTGITSEHIAAIGITNQRETTIVWDKHSGQPVYNAIVWQCRRTTELCEQLREQGWQDYVQENTGLVLDAYFSASKLKWILDNVVGARAKAEAGDLLFGTVDTWLLWKLTGGRVHATDLTNASRTMLFNIHSLQWDETLLALFDIPRQMLPELKSCSEIYGKTNIGGKGGTRIPIAGIAGDQQAALFGQQCLHQGMAKNTYGTGCFLLMNTGDKPVKSSHGLLTTIAMSLNGQLSYALEGSVFMGGATIQWLRDELGLIREAADTEYFAAKVADTNGVYLVPAFVGLGAPYWDPHARGSIVGLTRGANRNHIIRAALESIAYQSRDLLDAMQADAGIRLQQLRVDGGAVANDFLLQFQADLLATEVLRPSLIESTALGAAYLAGLAVGYWDGTESLAEINSTERCFTPNMQAQQRQQLYQGWQRAVDSCRSFSNLDAEQPA
ncbi:MULTISPECIES: glycerol kinase GlpK [unclassified Agarivorans]|uniref:glycerol kinase GlpK n=1 Tax=unclassified Agarivorans TaxID=2636026 RepID=UPI003D7EB6EA